MAVTADVPLRNGKSLRDRDLDELRVLRLGAGRWAPAADADEERAFVILYFSRGRSLLRRRDAVLPLERGDILLLPTANAHAAAVETDSESEVIGIQIPESTTRPYDRVMAANCGRRIPTRNGTARVVAQVVEALAAEPHDYAPTSPGRLAQHIAGLVTLMCAEQRNAPEGTGSAAILQRAKEHIEEHLGDYDLAPCVIARAMNVSTRTLQRLFEGERTTVSQWIRSRRLEHCRLELEDPVWSQVPVSTIGARWGLWDAPHFSRAFKTAYGVSPRAYRARSAARDASCTAAVDDDARTGRSGGRGPDPRSA